MNECRLGNSRPRWLCRWWLRTREGQPIAGKNPCREISTCEFYVPWWGWPLELLHRAIFGYAKLEKLDGNQ